MSGQNRSMWMRKWMLSLRCMIVKKQVQNYLAAAGILDRQRQTIMYWTHQQTNKTSSTKHTVRLTGTHNDVHQDSQFLTNTEYPLILGRLHQHRDIKDF